MPFVSFEVMAGANVAKAPTPLILIIHAKVYFIDSSLYRYLKALVTGRMVL